MPQISTKPNRFYPSIPGIEEEPEGHANVLRQIRESIETHERRNANYLKSFIRFEELIDLGIIDSTGEFVLAIDSTTTALGDLSDVTIVGGSDNQILGYDFASGEWTNQSAVELGLSEIGHTHAGLGATSLNDLTDVNTAGGQTWDLLFQNLTEWTPSMGALQFDGSSLHLAGGILKFYSVGDTPAQSIIPNTPSPGDLSILTAGTGDIHVVPVGSLIVDSANAIMDVNRGIRWDVGGATPAFLIVVEDIVVPLGLAGLSTTASSIADPYRTGTRWLLGIAGTPDASILWFADYGASGPDHVSFSFTTAMDWSTSTQINADNAIGFHTDHAGGSQSMVFSPDGLRIHWMNGDTEMYYEDLGTAFDLAGVDFTATPTETFSPFELGNSGGWCWSPDGTKIIISDWGNGVIRQFTCSVAGDVTTKSYDGQLDLSALSGYTNGSDFPSSIQRNGDGTEYYICDPYTTGETTITVFVIKPSDPNDILTTTAVDSIWNSADALKTTFGFAKLWTGDEGLILGSGDDGTIHFYSTGLAGGDSGLIVGDPAYKTHIDGTLIELELGIGINWLNAAAADIELLIFGGSTLVAWPELSAYTAGEVTEAGVIEVAEIRWNDDGTVLFLVADGDILRSHTFATPYVPESLTSPAFVMDNGLTFGIRDFCWSGDGTKLYTADINTKAIKEYANSGTPFNPVSGDMSLTTTFVPTANEDPRGIEINSDGTIIWYIAEKGGFHNKIKEVLLSTAYDLTSATEGAVYDFLGAVEGPYLQFRMTPDGTKMFAMDFNSIIHEYDLTTDDITTLSLTVNNIDVTGGFAPGGSPLGFDFSPDGSLLTVSSWDQVLIADNEFQVYSAIEYSLVVGDPAYLTQIDGLTTRVTSPATIIEGTLNVFGATDLDSTLNVDGHSDLRGGTIIYEWEDVATSSLLEFALLGPNEDRRIFRVSEEYGVSGQGFYMDYLGVLNSPDNLLMFGCDKPLGASQIITFGERGEVRIVDEKNTTPTLASTEHSFQIGPDTSFNLRLGRNEIQAVNNGAKTGLTINAYGGDVSFFNLNFSADYNDFRVYLGKSGATSGRFYLFGDSTNLNTFMFWENNDLKWTCGITTEDLNITGWDRVQFTNQPVYFTNWSGADYARFHHDDIDFNTTFAATVDWNITGLTGGTMLLDGSFTVDEKINVGVTTVTTTTYTAAAEHVILVDDDTAAATVTVTLPTAVTANTIYHIKKLGTTANVIVEGNGAETIDGALTATLTTQYESIMLVSDGVEWHVI